MGNSKAVGGIAGGIIIVAIIVIFASNQDKADVSNEILIETAPQDSSVTDTIATNNPDYIIDEEGNKRYVLSADDSPVLGD